VVDLSVAQWLVATIDRNRGIVWLVWQSRGTVSVSRGQAHVFMADVTLSNRLTARVFRRNIIAHARSKYQRGDHLPLTES
jgi:hypothetical protein